MQRRNPLDAYASAAATLGNVWLETSAMLVVAAAREVIERAPDRVLFGSDVPAMHPAVERQKIRVLHLPAEVEELMLGGNATRPLRLPAQAPRAPRDASPYTWARPQHPEVRMHR